jgi:Holliday junction resolvasome RuvABC ATP-dependent DNA helicase subunit
MKFFENYIGQKEAVAYSTEVCNAIAEGRNIPLQPVVFTGHAGNGKTYFAELMANEIARASAGKFRFYSINAAISIPDFVSFWVDNMEGKQAVVFIDEGHQIRKNMANFIKPLLETNRSIKQVRYADYVLTSNPFEHYWMVATNEEPKDTALFGPTGRFQSIMFHPYSPTEVKKLMEQKLAKWPGKLKIDDKALDFLVTRCVPNARAVSQLIEGDCLRIGGKFGMAEVKALCERFGYFPLGLRREDIKTLTFVGRDDKGRQVNEIAAAIGGEDARTTSYRLQILAGYNFISTQAGKKVLTADGKRYLLDLAELQKKAKKRA